MTDLSFPPPLYFEKTEKTPSSHIPYPYLKSCIEYSKVTSLHLADVYGRDSLRMLAQLLEVEIVAYLLRASELASFTTI